MVKLTEDLAISGKNESRTEMLALYEAILVNRNKAAALRLVAEGLFGKEKIAAETVAGVTQLFEDLEMYARRQKARILEVYPTAQIP